MNDYGLDTDYFKKELANLIRSLDKRTPEELYNYLTNLAMVVKPDEDYPGKPPCKECGAMTRIEAGLKCICGGDKDHCHGCDLWPD